MDDALNYADQALAIEPGNTGAALARTAALGAKGRFGESRAALAALLKAHPDLREAHLQLALLETAQGHYAEAEAGFRKYYQPGRGDVRSLEGLVEVYRAQKQLGRAVTLLRQDLDKGPQADEVRELLAKTAAQAGENQVAADAYKALAGARPQSFETALQLGLAYQAKGDLSLAISEFERAGKLAPEDARAPGFLGAALEAAGRRSEAAAAYHRSLLLDGRDPWVMNNLAYLLADTGGDLNDALKLAQAVNRQYPNNPSFGDTLGWVYLKRKDFSSAIQILRRLKDNSPADAGRRIHLGEALLASGDRSGAKSELEIAIALTSTADEHRMVERLLRDIRRPDGKGY